MSNQSIKETLTAQMKDAMRAKDQVRLNAIRLILADIKRVEVDTRVDLAQDDARVLAILDKMLKQRRDSIEHFKKAERQDLVDKEQFEIGVIQSFMPAQMSEAEILATIDEAIKTTGASSAKDMGKVMGLLKAKIQGRADIGSVSALIKSRLDQ
jgi:uncharacterized protein YqeY